VSYFNLPFLKKHRPSTEVQPERIDVAKPQPRVWPHAPRYSAVLQEGHRRPPPTFGAPTLVWHLGIWLPERAKKTLSWPTDPLPEEITPYEDYRQQDFDAFDKRNALFFSEFSDFLVHLQELGRVRRAPVQALKFSKPDVGYASDHPHLFQVCNPQSLNFTLWWRDGTGTANSNERPLAPAIGDLRIRVQAQTHVDHVTVSFFIDAGKPWGQARVFTTDAAQGARRRQIFRNIDSATAVSAALIRHGHVDCDLVPERGVTESDSKALEEAAAFLYDGIWSEFLDAFAIAQESGPNQSQKFGEVFADFRGLIMPTGGIATPDNRKRQQDAAALREGVGAPPPQSDAADATFGFGTFEHFDNESGEPNTVLKSFWPFVRRVIPDADRREFIACGINDWRDLYVTSLGAPMDGCEDDESPSGDGDRHDTGAHRPEPLRYLLLTKGQPHSQQIGRFVERINAIGTMRLFALKNWLTIRNAGHHIRLLGRELDSVLSEWSQKRREIDFRYSKKRVAAEIKYKRQAERFGWTDKMRRYRRPPRKLRIAEEEIQLIDDDRLKEINRLISDTESRLLSLGAALDNIGQGGSGQLLYAITRSDYFINEFYRMAASLEVGNIDTWINYTQFVDRGLRPTFDFIKGAGERFVSLRARLQMVSEIIQTSALIVEAEATRVNTETLRRIATIWYWARWGVFAIAVEILITLTWNVAGNLITERLFH